MCERAMGWLPRTTSFRGSKESSAARAGRCARSSTFAATHPDWRLRLVVGADILLEGERWHAFDRVTELAPLFVLGRAGVQTEGAPQSGLARVSSSAVRDAFARRGNGDASRGLVPRECSRTSRASALPRWPVSSAIFIIGAGKVGGALARALRATWRRRSRFARPARGCRAAHRRRSLDSRGARRAARRARRRAARQALGHAASTAVVHCAGALGPEPLAPLRAIARRGRADAPDDLVRLAKRRALARARSGARRWRPGRRSHRGAGRAPARV